MYSIDSDDDQTNRRRYDEHVDDVEVGCVRDLPVLHLLAPVLVEQQSEVLVERSRVGQEGRGDQHITHQAEKHNTPRCKRELIIAVALGIQ